MTTGREDVDAAIERAVSALDTAIIENRLHDDPLRHVLTGLIAFLTAQRRLYADGAVSLAQHLEQARQPVQNETIRRGVADGIRDYAIGIVQAIRLGTAAAIAGLVLVFSLMGFGFGSWWQSDRMAAQIDNANRMVVEAHELGGVVLSARSAAIWTELVRLNPNVAEEFRDCQPLKQSAGSACALPVWTMPAPPKMETPATH